MKEEEDLPQKAPRSQNPIKRKETNRKRDGMVEVEDRMTDPPSMIPTTVPVADLAECLPEVLEETEDVGTSCMMRTMSGIGTSSRRSRQFMMGSAMSMSSTIGRLA